MSTVTLFLLLQQLLQMSTIGRKRSKRQGKIVTYADDSIAQKHASYERVAVVTKSGAIKHKRVEQNLAPKRPPAVGPSQPAPAVGNMDYIAGEPAIFPDDVLGDAELPGYRKPRKVSIGNNLNCSRLTDVIL